MTSLPRWGCLAYITGTATLMVATAAIVRAFM